MATITTTFPITFDAKSTPFVDLPRLIPPNHYGTFRVDLDRPWSTLRDRTVSANVRTPWDLLTDRSVSLWNATVDDERTDKKVVVRYGDELVAFRETVTSRLPDRSWSLYVHDLGWIQCSRLEDTPSKITVSDLVFLPLDSPYTDQSTVRGLSLLQVHPYTRTDTPMDPELFPEVAPNPQIMQEDAKDAETRPDILLDGWDATICLNLFASRETDAKTINTAVPSVVDEMCKRVLKYSPTLEAKINYLRLRALLVERVRADILQDQLKAISKSFLEIFTKYKGPGVFLCPTPESEHVAQLRARVRAEAEAKAKAPSPSPQRTLKPGYMYLADPHGPDLHAHVPTYKPITFDTKSTPFTQLPELIPKGYYGMFSVDLDPIPGTVSLEGCVVPATLRTPWEMLDEKHVTLWTRYYPDHPPNKIDVRYGDEVVSFIETVRTRPPEDSWSLALPTFGWLQARALEDDPTKITVGDLVYNPIHAPRGTLIPVRSLTLREVHRFPGPPARDPASDLANSLPRTSRLIPTNLDYMETLVRMEYRPDDTYNRGSVLYGYNIQKLVRTVADTFLTHYPTVKARVNYLRLRALIVGHLPTMLKTWNPTREAEDGQIRELLDAFLEMVVKYTGPGVELRLLTWPPTPR